MSDVTPGDDDAVRGDRGSLVDPVGTSVEWPGRQPMGPAESGTPRGSRPGSPLPISPDIEQCVHEWARLNRRKWCPKCGADGGPFVMNQPRCTRMSSCVRRQGHRGCCTAAPSAATLDWDDVKAEAELHLDVLRALDFGPYPRNDEGEA